MSRLISANVLAAAVGATWLLYSGTLRLRAFARRRPEDVALLATVTFEDEREQLLQAFGVSGRFDFSLARSLVHERVDTRFAVVLLYAGTLIPLLVQVALSVIPFSLQIPAVWLASVVPALGLAIIGHEMWLRFTVDPFLDRAWLTFLENATDPLARSPNPSQDLMLIVQSSMHPELERLVHEEDFLDMGRIDLSAEARQAIRRKIERWIVRLAKKRGYHFRSDGWQEFQRSLKSQE